MSSNNPLKQYFRRPAIYINLPSKLKYYDESVIEVKNDEEIPVFPMTAIDEITSRTPDAVMNGHAVVDIIKSCIPAIRDPWKINSIDMDNILVAIRVATTGDTMDVMSVCPHCQQEGKYGVNLIDILNRKDVNVDYDKTLKIRDLEIKFCPLTFRDTNKNGMIQYELQRIFYELSNMEDSDEKNKIYRETLDRMNSTILASIASTVEYIKTPDTIVPDHEFIVEFLENCDRDTHNLIKEKSIELSGASRLKPLKVKCSSCENEYEQDLNLNISDFFA